MPVVINILLAIHIMVSLLIVLIVLMQRPKNEGLGAAFGGGMTDNLFGAQTTNVLQTITRWLGAIFFLLTLLLSVLYVRQASNNKSGVQKRLSEAPTVVPATPAPDLPTAASPPVQVTDAPSTAAVTVPATPPAEAKVPAEAPKPAAPAPSADSAKEAPAASPKTAEPTPASEAKPADAPKPAEPPKN